MDAVQLESVTKIYRKGFRAVKVPAVIDCSFSVKKARITGFVGPNGAGKTTTIKMIIGLVRPTIGRVLLGSIDAAKPNARTGVAYLSEQPYFYNHLTVYEALCFAAELSLIPRSSIDTEITRVLQLVELSQKRASKIKEFSKGMQQRLNMAQALLGNPHTLIFDEPMSGMDPPGRRLFRELLHALRGEGKTIFFSTHVLEDIESLCDDVVVLRQGRLTYAGGVEELLTQGFKGTDIRTGSMSNTCADALKNIGCTVQPGQGDEQLLFVPKEVAIEAVQQLLRDNAVIYRAMERRAQTLETMLYKNRSDGL